MAEAPTPQLVDIGANLTHESFREDLSEVLNRANASGVTRLLVTGADHDGVEQALTLAQDHPGLLWSTAGIHPHHAKDCHSDTLDLLRNAAQHTEVVALGEMGLDFFRDFSPRKLQEQWFCKQLELAVELQKPAFLHERDAHDAFFEILRDYRPQLPGVVVHCFTGNGKALDAYLAADCYIGITGWVCDERRGAHLAELVPQIPDNRLLIETDAPYLLPRDLSPKPKSRRNEPAYLPHIANHIASLRGQDIKQVASFTSSNAEALFNLNSSQVAI